MAAVAKRTNAGRRVVGASVVGTVIESYDFALFGLGAALVFGDQFFPKGRPGTGLLASLATFAVGFFVRPIGGVVLSHLGDRIGRRPLMVFTLLLMGFATVGIGLLPTYESAGLLSPALLVLLRLAQGFGAGAEYVAAILVIAESGSRRGRGWRNSLPGAGFFAGVLLATLVFTAVSTMPDATFAAWGWRLPFLFSAVTVLIGLYFRLGVGETTAFQAVRAQGRVGRFPLREVVREQPRNLAIAFTANGPFVALYYLVQVFLLAYVTRGLGLSSTVGLVATFTASAAAMILVPVFGELADRIGRRPVWLGGAAFLMAFGFPMFWLVESKNAVLVVVAMTLELVAIGAMVGAQSSLFPELFETRYRFSGFALAREVSAAVVAGPAPFVAAALLQSSGGASWPIAVLVMTLAAVAFAAILLAPETRQVDLARTTV